jgi:response regulator RpfG family c-di-GMP phosphodiesterase
VHLAAHSDELRAHTDWRDGLSLRRALQALQKEAGVRHDPSLVAILAEYQSELEVADAGI